MSVGDIEKQDKLREQRSWNLNSARRIDFAFWVPGFLDWSPGDGRQFGGWESQEQRTCCVCTGYTVTRGTFSGDAGPDPEPSDHLPGVAETPGSPAPVLSEATSLQKLQLGNAYVDPFLPSPDDAKPSRFLFILFLSPPTQDPFL